MAANVAYTVVPGFTVTTEVDWDRYGHFDDGTPFGNWTKADKKNSRDGIVRFQRSFGSLYDLNGEARGDAAGLFVREQWLSNWVLVNSPPYRPRSRPC